MLPSGVTELYSIISIIDDKSLRNGKVEAVKRYQNTEMNLNIVLCYGTIERFTYTKWC